MRYLPSPDKENRDVFHEALVGQLSSLPQYPSKPGSDLPPPRRNWAPVLIWLVSIAIGINVVRFLLMGGPHGVPLLFLLAAVFCFSQPLLLMVGVIAGLLLLILVWFADQADENAKK